MWNKALQNKPKHTWTHELKSNAHLNASIENRLATNNHKSIKKKLRGQKGEKKTHIRLLSAKQCERRERDLKSIKRNHDESLAKFT